MSTIWEMTGGVELSKNFTETTCSAEMHVDDDDDRSAVITAKITRKVDIIVKKKDSVLLFLKTTLSIR